jgi:hypothetical protein
LHATTELVLNSPEFAIVVDDWRERDGRFAASASTILYKKSRYVVKASIYCGRILTSPEAPFLKMVEQPGLPA